MLDTSVPASPTEATTRAERGYALWRTRGSEIVHLHGSVYAVPTGEEERQGARQGEERYRVDYSDESCSCLDYFYRSKLDTWVDEGPCKHVHALGCALAKRRSRPGFRCDGCGVRAPHCDGHDIHPEHSFASGVFEVGMRVCRPCGRAYDIV